MSTAKPDSDPTISASNWASPLLAHVALVALVLFSIGQAMAIFAPRLASASREQKVFISNPSGGTPADLGKLLDEGWRVTNVSTSMSAIAHTVPNGVQTDKWFVNTVYVLER